MKKTLYILIASLFFFSCSTDSNYVKPTDRNISSVIITYDEKLTNYSLQDYCSFLEEYFIKMQKSYSPENIIELNVNEKYWKMLIDRIKKSKKFSEPFRAPRNPGQNIFLISIKYHNGKETYVNIPEHSYYIINGSFYVPQVWKTSIVDIINLAAADNKQKGLLK